MITEHVFLMLGLVRRTGFPKKSPIPLSLFFTREKSRKKKGQGKEIKAKGVFGSLWL